MRIGPQRPVDPDAIVAPAGFRVEALVVGLTFPSAISFGPGGELYLAERGGIGGRVVAAPRVLRVDPDESINEIGRLENPIVGVAYRPGGELLIAEDGYQPRILLVTASGELRCLARDLPGGGDYGLSGLSLDAGGALLFGLGTRTNSGVVGLDNAARGWVHAHPEWADTAGADVELEGVNYVTAEPGTEGRVTTGGFKPFGHRAEPGERVRGTARCGGAVYRMAPEATEPERLCWGMRNPVGIAAGPEGRILVTEGGMEERGSRPIAGATDNLWSIKPGGYYGWPDHAGGVPVADARFRVPGHPLPRPLLRGAPSVSGLPLATFPARSGVGRLDWATSPSFGHAGELFVALSGPWTLPAYPQEGPAVPGRVVRVDPRTGAVAEFLYNRQAGAGGLERPLDVRFDPTGEVLYVVDFGEVHLSREYGAEPFGGTGVLWRVTRARVQMTVPALGDEAASDAGPEPEPTDQDGPEAEWSATEEPEAEWSVTEEPETELGATEEPAQPGVEEPETDDSAPTSGPEPETAPADSGEHGTGVPEPVEAPAGPQETVSHLLPPPPALELEQPSLAPALVAPVEPAAAPAADVQDEATGAEAVDDPGMPGERE
jgi:glucose/arabinose dehydrogenase